LAVAIAPAPTSVLPGAAGQHDDARAAVPEALDGLLLVRAQRPAVLVQVDRVRLAVHVTGQVLGGPAQLEQRLLDLPALGGVDDHRVRVDTGADQRLNFFDRRISSSTGSVAGLQDQAVGGVLEEAQPAVAGHRLGDVDQQGVRHRVAGVLHERVHDLLGVVPGGAGVPQAERGHPVGVDVLGGALQLGERRDGAAARLGLLVVDLEQERLVALDDERSVHAPGSFRVA
jgi:hypothetical protein